MKKTISFSLLCAALVIYTFLLPAGCSKEGKKTETYTIYNPVYKSRANVLSSINGISTTAVEHAGKLYLKDKFIYLNDVNKGIHIIDNGNPSKPVQVAFLSIPGNLDIAIKNNILYADMYGDLLALNITDPRHVKIASIIKDFFTGREWINNHLTTTDDLVAVDWIEKDTTVVIDDVSPYPTNCISCEFNSGNNSTPHTKGMAGSMAAMVLINNHLYAITSMNSLGIIDVNNAANPTPDSSFFTGFELQTIYPFEDKLFLGSATGMFVYDVTDPKHPFQTGQFSHSRACDPVIADGDYAYVTLHIGTSCGGEQNELDVVNVQDITNSFLIKTYNLTKPTGLSKDGDLLFVCDSTNVNVYNAADPINLILLHQIKSNSPYDVIAANKKLVVVNSDGLYQYSYNDINNIRRLSFVSAKR